MKTTILTALLALLWAAAATARNITGRVTDEHQQPLQYVNVVALNTADSTFVQGSVTDADGRFTLAVGDLQTCLLKVTSVEFEPIYMELTADDAGTIVLHEMNHTLGEVVVKANRPQYRNVAGGLAVDVEHSMLAQTGTAADVLSLLPRVNVDSKGEVSIFGKGTPIIYINNKKVQNKNELQQLKSTDIKQVDIITNPGARYDAGVRSVIRIKTVKPQGEGLSFRADNNVKYNDYWSGFQEDYVKYRKGGLETFADAYVYTGVNVQQERIWQEIHGQDEILVDQRIIEHNRSWGLYGKVGASYDFDADNSVGVSYTLNRDFYNKGRSAGGRHDIYRNDVLEDHIDQRYETDGTAGPSHEANAYYVGKIGSVGVDLNLSCVWNKNQTDKYSYEDSPAEGLRTITTNNRQRSRLLAGKLVLSVPVWRGTLSFGSELTRTYSQSVYANLEGLMPAADNEVRERNVAGFAEYSLPLGNLTLGAGLRYEHVVSNYYAFGQREDEPSRRYGNWFPSLSVAWQKGNLGLQLAYTTKTSRPPYYYLRSEIQYDNRHFYEGGNPYLRPAIIHSLDLMATWSWLSAMAGYTYYSHDLQQVPMLYDEGETGIVRPMNFDRRQVAYVSVVASPKFGWYQPTFEANLNRQFFDAEEYGADRNLNKNSFLFSVKNRFELPHDFSASLNYYHTVCLYDGFVYKPQAANLELQLIKQFCHKQWTVNLRISNLLNTDREDFEIYGRRVNVGKESSRYLRRASLTVTYNFNASGSKYKGKGAGNAEKNRL